MPVGLIEFTVNFFEIPLVSGTKWFGGPKWSIVSKVTVNYKVLQGQCHWQGSSTSVRTTLRGIAASDDAGMAVG